MKNALRYFTAACLSFTRLPLPFKYLTDADFKQATAFLPWVGLLLGLISAAVLQLSLFYFSPVVAIILALATSIIITGALHEDGFADTIDAFFVSHKSPEQRLAIMKDPHLGSFASLALLVSFLLKLALLLDIQSEQQALSLVLVFATARLAPLWLMHRLDKIPQHSSKLSQHIIKPPAIMLSSLLLLLLHLYFTGVNFSLAVIVVLLLTVTACTRLIKSRLGAYNGDTLGFTEHITECVLLALWAAIY